MGGYPRSIGTGSGFVSRICREPRNGVGANADGRDRDGAVGRVMWPEYSPPSRAGCREDCTLDASA